MLFCPISYQIILITDTVDIIKTFLPVIVFKSQILTLIFGIAVSEGLRCIQYLSSLINTNFAGHQISCVTIFISMLIFLCSATQPNVISNNDVRKKKKIHDLNLI